MADEEKTEQEQPTAEETPRGARPSPRRPTEEQPDRRGDPDGAAASRPRRRRGSSSRATRSSPTQDLRGGRRGGADPARQARDPRRRPRGRHRPRGRGPPVATTRRGRRGRRGLRRRRVRGPDAADRRRVDRPGRRRALPRHRQAQDRRRPRDAEARHRRVRRSTAARSRSTSRAPRCSARSASRSRPSATRTRMDVVATMHGGGVSAQAGALRHGISRALLEADPNLRVGAQAPRLPDARRARQGAQEGRPEEGPQAAAVLQALAGLARPSRLRRAAPAASCSAPTASAESRASSSPRSWRWRWPAPPRRGSPGGSRPRVLVIRDTRESGEMLEAAVAAGVAAAGGEALLGGVLPTPGAPLLIAPLRLRPRRRALGLAQPVRRQRHQVLRRRRLQALRRHRARDRGGARASRPRRPPRSAACAARTARSRTTCARSHERFADLDLSGAPDPARLRQRRDLPRRAGDLPPPRRRRRRRSPPSPTGATSTRLRLHPRRGARRGTSPTAATTSASPSTATATACWPSTATAPSSTATS